MALYTAIVRLLELEVSGYRNLDRVNLAFSGDRAVFVGENAQGKSNLLEAIYLLATMRAARAETDAQVVSRAAYDEVLPAARVVGHVSTGAGPLKIEVTVVTRPGANGPIGTKTVKVNGVSKRMSDAIGRMTAVLFTADDLEMISGAPSLRRRYLDTTLAQVEPQYASARSRFERVLTQRNSLLKRIREGLAREDELAFWDSELAKDGALLLHRRAQATGTISRLARTVHSHLAPGENLSVSYRPKIETGTEIETLTEDELIAAYTRALAAGMGRDTTAGMTLTGPHRDDVEFVLDDFAVAGFASRAQQRTVALSLRLAEAKFLEERRGEAPVLLLDDILSEMDAARRGSVLAAIGDVDQMMVTGTDWDRFPADFLAGASLFRVEGGSVQPAVAKSPGATAAE